MNSGHVLPTAGDNKMVDENNIHILTKKSIVTTYIELKILNFHRTLPVVVTVLVNSRVWLT